MSNIKILIATQKKVSITKNDILLPIQVGKKLFKEKLDMQGDDEGDNISEKNSNYCELTALYWAWKNLNTEIIGLFHYRRYFKFDNNLFPKRLYNVGTEKLKNYIISQDRIEHILNKHDIILSKPKISSRSIKINYKRSHHIEDLEIVTDIIKNKYPSYFNTWELIINKTNKFSTYNMFICRFDIFDKYCQWLFGILFEAEKHIKLSPDFYQRRVFGFLGERLFWLYCIKNKLDIKFLPVYKIQKGEVIKDSTFFYHFNNLLKNLVFYTVNFRKIFVE